MQKRFIKNEDAVSPVIGVILMVAITVILAAIIAGVVLPLASKTTVAPVASLVVVNSTNSNNQVGLQHKGGDPLNLDEIRITGSFENGTSSFSIGDAANVQVLMNPGDTMVLDLDLAAVGTTVGLSGAYTTAATLTGSLDFDSGQRIKIGIFHVPSGKAVTDLTFTAS